MSTTASETEQEHEAEAFRKVIEAYEESAPDRYEIGWVISEIVTSFYFKRDKRREGRDPANT